MKVSRTRALQNIRSTRRAPFRQIRILSKPNISISIMSDTTDDEYLMTAMESERHQRLIRLLYWLLRLGSIELSLNRTQMSRTKFQTGKWTQKSQANHPTIRFKLFSVMHSSISNILLSVLQFIMIIIFLKVTYLIIPLVKIHFLWRFVAPRSSSSLSSKNSTRCDIFYQSPDEHNALYRYLRARNTFETNGGSSHLEPITLLLYAVGSIYVITIWFGNYFVIGKKGVVIDFLDFIIDPIKFRYEFDAELAKTTESLKTSIQFLGAFQSNIHKAANSISLVNSNQKILMSRIDLKYSKRYHGFQRLRDGDPTNRIIGILNQLKKLHLIKPNNLNYSWFLRLDELVISIMSITQLFQVFWPLVAIFVCQTGHIMEETRIRILFGECMDLFPNKTIRRDLLGCNWNNQQPDRKQFDLYRYQSFSDDMVDDLVDPMFRYTLDQCTNGDILLSLFQVYLSMAIFSANFLSLLVIYFIAHMDKFKWMAEIEAQVDEACNYVENPDLQTKSTAQSFRVKSLDMNDTYEIVLMKLILPYINYTLFRRRHVRFKKFNDCVHIGTTLSVIILLAVLYYTLLHGFDGSRPSLVACLATIVLSINIISIFPSVFINRILKLRKKMAKLVEIGQSSRIDLAIPLTLWRNILLEESELIALFGQRSIFGHLSFNRLITINAYLMAIWIMTFKSD